MSLIQTILNFSERAARIARVIRQDPCLFSLLIEEKGEAEKNERFVQDFKTLADVLIQETFRDCLSSKFSNLSTDLRGEESSSFTNTLGDNINVQVCRTQKETATLLAKVLGGNTRASGILAEVVHEDVENVDIEEQLKKQSSLFESNGIGLWIDPIDSTAEYIKGNLGERDANSKFYKNGLPCVTVLIGIYDKISGLPVGGIINQPFAKNITNSSWKSEIFWGLCCKNSNVYNSVFEPISSGKRPVLVISRSERDDLQIGLKNYFELLQVTGAGYKSLVVSLGLAETYFCSKGWTYRWDTCAPHGILRSMGGGIISVESLFILGKEKKLSSANHLLKHQLTYHMGNADASSDKTRWANSDGLVVYRNPKVLTNIYESIKTIP